MAKQSILFAEVREQLEQLGKDEIMNYVKAFSYQIDYNLVEYGNLLVYYSDIRDMFKRAEYKEERYTNEQIWNLYKSIVRVVVNKYFIK